MDLTHKLLAMKNWKSPGAIPCTFNTSYVTPLISSISHCSALLFSYKYCSLHSASGFNKDDVETVPVSSTALLYSTSFVSSCTGPFFLYHSSRFSNADRTLMCFVKFIWMCWQTKPLFPYLSTSLIRRLISFVY